MIVEIKRGKIKIITTRLKSFNNPKVSGSIFTTLLSICVGLWLVNAQAAGNASLSLSPASGSHTVNTNLTVTVYENSGNQEVAGVGANLSYDPSKLEFVSISTQGSAFDTCPQTTGGGGNVIIECVVVQNVPPQNTQKVASVTFKTLVSNTSAEVKFRSDSAVYESIPSSTTINNLWNGNESGGTYSIVAPPAPPPAPPTSSNPSPTPTPSRSPSSNVSTSNNKEESGYSISSIPAQQASPSVPVPVSEAPQAIGNEQSGYMVAIKVVDESNKVVKGATVTIGDQTVLSDPTGIASFANVSAGKYNIIVKGKEGSITTSNLEITSDVLPSDVQELTVKLQSSKVPYLLILPALLIVALAAIIPSLYQKYPWQNLRRKKTTHHTHNTTSKHQEAPFSDLVHTPKIIKPTKSSKHEK